MNNRDPILQYHTAFKIGITGQIVLGILWLASGRMGFGLLSVVNLMAMLFIYPWLLTVLELYGINLWNLAR